MRIGLALEALDFLVDGMRGLDRRGRLDSYGTTQVLLDRLRTIAKARGLSSGQINALLLKVQMAAETLSGLGGGRAGEDEQVAAMRAAIEGLRGPSCFGMHLDENE
jgi:hypothetical protein